jgi:hypothetical protein
MVRAALCPLSQTHQEAAIWLDNLFEICDKDPTSDMIHCNASSKKEVWELYANEKKSLDQDALNYSDFDNIWNGLYPHASCRPFVGIPGKCHICCEIDRMRRTCSDKHVHLRLKEAHHMHRGGFEQTFMLEREG